MNGDVVDLLGWVDVESTGLDVENDEIIEIGIIITDGALNEIAASSALRVLASEIQLGGMNDFVREMHTKNGLLAELKGQGGYRVLEAQELLLDFLHDIAPPGEVPMAGSSVGSLDRPLMRRQMPQLHDWFSYRSVDVSSFKEAMYRWAPWVIDSRPKEEVGHRVLADIRDSIREFRHYKGWIQRGTESHTYL